MKRCPVLLLISLLIPWISCKKEEGQDLEPYTVQVYDPLPVKKSIDMQLYVHYMPWFDDPETSGNGEWGWHWRMNTMDPDITDASGKRQIASHYYPLIGPYASSDPALIEYHLLLMKYSGIDGLLIDWYGSSDALDYATNRRNTEALIELLDRVGLKFAIVYEDATIPRVMESTGNDDALSLAREDMLYLSRHYFNRPSYIHIGANPLLLVFGPGYFKSAAQWETILQVFSTKPVLMSLWGHSSATGSASSGEYIWVDQADTDDKYATKDQFDFFMGGAWPGFHDFYEEGDAGNTLFTIDHSQGEIWLDLLNKALEYQPEYLQLITWNDFGEGTMLEPTREYGYLFLTTLQLFAGLSYGQNELESIARQYFLRKKQPANPIREKVLDQAFYFWVSLQPDKAVQLIDSLENAMQ